MTRDISKLADTNTNNMSVQKSLDESMANVDLSDDADNTTTTTTTTTTNLTNAPTTIDSKQDDPSSTISTQNNDVLDNHDEVSGNNGSDKVTITHTINSMVKIDKTGEILQRDGDKARDYYNEILIELANLNSMNQKVEEIIHKVSGYSELAVRDDQMNPAGIEQIHHAIVGIDNVLANLKSQVDQLNQIVLNNKINGEMSQSASNPHINGQNRNVPGSNNHTLIQNNHNVIQNNQHPQKTNHQQQTNHPQHPQQPNHPHQQPNHPQHPQQSKILLSNTTLANTIPSNYQPIPTPQRPQQQSYNPFVVVNDFFSNLADRVVATLEAPFDDGNDTTEPTPYHLQPTQLNNGQYMVHNGPNGQVQRRLTPYEQQLLARQQQLAQNQQQQQQSVHNQQQEQQQQSAHQKQEQQPSNSDVQQQSQIVQQDTEQGKENIQQDTEQGKENIQQDTEQGKENIQQDHVSDDVNTCAEKVNSTDSVSIDQDDADVTLHGKEELLNDNASSQDQDDKIQDKKDSVEIPGQDDKIQAKKDSVETQDQKDNVETQHGTIDSTQFNDDQTEEEHVDTMKPEDYVQSETHNMKIRHIPL